MGTLTKLIEYPPQDILRYVFPANQIPTWTVTATSGLDETISVPEYSSAQLATALATYLANLPTEAAAEAAAKQAEAQQIVDLINSTGATGSLEPSLITQGGRAYLKRGGWYTGADDVYGGYSHPNHSEGADDNAVPTVEWEHLGLLIPAGRRLGKFHLTGRTNSSSISELEIYIGMKEPNPLTRWESGMDNDSELSMVPVYQDLFMNPAVGTPFTGNINDIHRRTYDLDHTVANDSLLMIYMRAPYYGSSSTKYFYHTWTLEVY